MTTNPIPAHAIDDATTALAGGFDPAVLERLIDAGVFLETAAGLLPAELPTPAVDHDVDPRN
jgi:hypothetical protein